MTLDVHGRNCQVTPQIAQQNPHFWERHNKTPAPLNQAMLAFTTILMYASAVFYSINQVELPLFQKILGYNPVAFFCEQSRNLAVLGMPMDWHWYGRVFLAGLAFMMLAYTVFMRVKHTFADVV